MLAASLRQRLIKRFYQQCANAFGHSTGATEEPAHLIRELLSIRQLATDDSSGPDAEKTGNDDSLPGYLITWEETSRVIEHLMNLHCIEGMISVLFN